MTRRHAGTSARPSRKGDLLGALPACTSGRRAASGALRLVRQIEERLHLDSVPWHTHWSSQHSSISELAPDPRRLRGDGHGPLWQRCTILTASQWQGRLEHVMHIATRGASQQRLVPRPANGPLGSTEPPATCRRQGRATRKRRPSLPSGHIQPPQAIGHHLNAKASGRSAPHPAGC